MVFRSWSMPALLLLLHACSGDARVTTLRIGMNPWPGYAQLAVAKEYGAFAAQGLDVQIVEYSSLHDLRRGFASGQIDVLPSTLVEVLELHAAAGPRPAVVWVADASEGADRIIGRGCRHFADLRGKRVAHEPGTLGAYMLGRALQLNGLASADVVAVGLDQVHMEEALAEGRIDAAVTYPPYAQRLLALPDTHTLFTSADVPGEIIDTISIERSLLDRDPTLLARFQSAMVSIERHVAADPVGTAAIVARVCGMTPAELVVARQGIVLQGAADQLGWLGSPVRLLTLARQLGEAQGRAADWRPSPALLAAGRLSPLLPPAAPR